MDALASSPTSPIAPATTVTTAGQIPLAYRLIMLREVVTYIAFTILWLFGYARAILSFFLSLLLKPILPFLTSPPARQLNRPRTAQALHGHGERASHAHIRSKPSSHSRNPPVTPTPSAASQFPLKRRPQPPWVKHKPVSSSASSTSSRETKDRSSTSITRSCDSAPATPLKSPFRLDFSDSEEYFPRVVGPSSHQLSSTSLRPPALTDNEGEPNRGRARSIKDHSSRRILFNSELRSSPSNTRPVPPLMPFDSLPYLADVESRSQTDTEQPATVFVAEPEEMEISTPDDILSSTAPRVRKRASWKKLFSKPRVATTDQTTTNAEVSPVTSTPNLPTLPSAKDKENSFLRMFGKPQSTSATVSSEQPTAAAANDAEVANPKKKSALRKFGKKASRKGAADVPSPTDARSPLPRVSTSNPHLPLPKSPSGAKLSFKHAATFGHCSKSSSKHAPSNAQPVPPQPPSAAPSKQQHPKESKNGPGYAHSGMHTLLHPIQAYQAHLYNVHGIGSGPSTLDLLTPMPIPKGGVKRTDPYAELGLGLPRAPTVSVMGSRRASAPSTVQTEREHDSKTKSD